jgi:hypothetical protein
MKASELIKEIERQPGFADDPEVGFHIGVSGETEVPLRTIRGTDKKLIVFLEHECSRAAECEEPAKRGELPEAKTLEQMVARELVRLASDFEAGRAKLNCTIDEGSFVRNVWTGKGEVRITWKEERFEISDSKSEKAAETVEVTK